MASLVEFVGGLFEEGRVVLRGRPVPGEDEDPAVRELLGAAFDLHRLDVAGPPIDFDFPAALMAADLLRQACWFLLNRSEPVEEMERRLAPRRGPRTAPEHLSADLTLRFLPQVHRRALAIAPGDRLAKLLAEVFRRWPLSGVLSDLAEGPDDVGDLGGHPGLWLLYAERLARRDRPAWRPRLDGPRGYVERVGPAAGVALG